MAKSECFVARDGKRKQVGTLGWAFTHQHLGRHVEQRALLSLGLLGIDQVRYAEVDDLH